VVGGSSGGHLSLMLATRGGPGPATAADPVDRESSAVRAAAIFFPVTDLLNLGSSTENLGDGGPPKSFRRAFGPQGTNLTVWKVIGRDCSPIYHVTSNLPPVLIHHGDAEHADAAGAIRMVRRKVSSRGPARDAGGASGGRHGWWSMLLDVQRFADWFDEHLRR